MFLTASLKKQISSSKILAAFIVITQFVPLGGNRLSASESIETAGDILQCVLPAAAVGLTLRYHDREGALQFGKSMALSMGVTHGLKYSLDTERPDGGSHSFPSGHTSSSFCSAEFIRKRYGWEYGLPAYAVASFVAYSRVESRKHCTWDVVAGAGIGILSSYVFTEPYKGWQVSLEGGAKSFGVRWSKKF